MGRLPLACSDLHDFRAQRPRMRIDDFSAPFGKFVAHVSVAVTTVDHRPGRGDCCPAADTAFASGFAVLSEDGTCTEKSPAAAMAVAQHVPSPAGTSRGADSAAITDPAASTPSTPDDPAPSAALPPSGRICTRTRRQTAAAAGVSPPAVDYGFWPAGVPRPSTRRANTPPRVSRPRPPLAAVTPPLLLPPRPPRRYCPGGTHP